MKTSSRPTVGPFYHQRAHRWLGAIGCALTLGGCDSKQPPDAAAPGVSSTAPVGALRAPLVSSAAIEVTGDTFVRSLTPNQNLGGDTRLSLQALGRHRSILFFDPSAIRAEVGTGSVVSARIELSLASTGTNWGSGRPIAIHRLAQASGEHTATWACAIDSNLNNLQPDCSGATAWSMNATDPAQQPWVSPPTATSLITNGQAGSVSFDVTADVAAILAGSYAGHGWLVKKVDEGQAGSLEFASRELGPAPRLLLEIEGAPAEPEPPGPVTGSATLQVNRDSELHHLLPNQNFGTENTLRIQALGKNRGLVGFDAPALVAALGGPLVRARLRLPIAATAGNWGPNRALGVHRLRRTWTELGATWNCAVDSNTTNFAADCSGESAWSMTGPTEELAWLITPTDTALIADGQTGTLELDVTRDVACALAGHEPLQGWLVKKAMESQSGRIDLHSREAAQAPSILLEWTNVNGVVVSAADCGVSGPPGGCTPTSPEDTTCDGVDDDCDGEADDDFAIQATACGVGACSASGETSCISGQVSDSCTAGVPAASDATCDGVDEDCDGVADEDFVPACNGAAVASCAGGVETLVPCTDNDACNGDESCAAGGCQAGIPPALDDGNPCTADACDPDTGAVHTAVAAGTSCADSNVCNGAEACDGAGSCQAGSPLNVDDGNPCTADACDPAAGASHVPVAAGTSCADANLCDGSEACDGAGVCAAGTPLVTDDGNPCTVDACDPAAGATHAPVAAGTSCADADLCDGSEACDGAGVCLPGQPLSVDDQNPCTVDGCNPASGVTHEPAAAGTDCADESVCDGAEVCDGAGSCGAGLPVDVDDGDPCTIDGCSDAQGVTHAPVPAGTACEDGDVCNGTETCTSDGSCAAGTPLPTSGPSGPCVVETTCHPSFGLIVSYEPEGTACGQGFICDGAGSCLRDQGDGSPPPPLPPGGAAGITVYGPTLPRDPVDDCALEAIAPDHVAVITGTVTTWDPVQQQSVPVPNARVTIPERCQLGAAWTLADGTFRYPVNGGERYMIRVEADADGDGTFDYLPVERAVEAKWRASVGIEDVELVLPAEVSETLALVGSAVTQDIVLNGPVSEDDRDGDGIAAARTPSVLFKAGTIITGIDANGATVALDAAAIRMTEYTVGEQGAQRMPAPMPPGTGYGYAIELSIDGVDDAVFDQPAVFYVDNFIGAEAARAGGVSAPHQVGMPVPAWYYDRHQGAWLQENDGIIIRLVGVDGSSPPQALIDADGDGDADLADENYLLARDFIVDVAEREQLAAEIGAGRRSIDDELWRIEIAHFSSFDWNWLLHCGQRCLVGSLLDTPALGGVNGPQNCKPGSAVNVESMSLSESFDVAGTPFSLSYSSRAVYGYTPRREQRVNRSQPPLPPPLSIASIRERLAIAGKSMSPEGCEFTPSGAVCHEYDGFSVTPLSITWDGRDADGRIAYGTHRGGWSVTTTVQAQTASALFVRDFVKGLPLQMTVYDAKILGLGGWTLSPHHFYDAEAGTLFRGDGGEDTTGVELMERVRDMTFNPTFGSTGGLHVMRDGTLFFANAQGVHRINAEDQLETWHTGFQRVIAPDGPDRLFVGNAAVQTVSVLERLEYINGSVQVTATANPVNRMGALAVGPDNLVYALVNTNPISVHRYTLDLEHADEGIAHFTVPGNASAAAWSAMSFDDETLYLAVGNAGGIFRFGPDDDNPVRIGNGGGFVGSGFIEGTPALSAPANNNTNFRSVRATADGVLFTRTNDKRLWLIDNEGILRRVAGDPAAGDGAGEGGPALLAGLGNDFSFDVAPDGSLLLYMRFPTATIRRIRAPGPEGFAALQTRVPSEDGTLEHDFDLDGHHLRTRNVLTNDVIHSFEYEDGLLSAIVHGDNLSSGGPTLPRTRILRDVGGVVTIEAPSGQRTRIELDSNGYASRIIDAAGASVALHHDAGGLLRGMTDQRGFVHAYDYDDAGRLVSDTSPGLAPQTLEGLPLASVTHTNGESERSQYQMSLNQSTGASSRTVQGADGSSMTQTVDKALKRRQTYSDGSIVDETYIKHPTFGTASPILGARVTRLPSGLSRTESHALSLTGGVWTETFGLNGQVATTRTNQALNTVTTTTAQGRTLASTLDTLGRPTQVRVGNLEPVQLTYDAQGRVLLMTRGSGAAARTTDLQYYPDNTGFPESGHLMTITDPLNHTVDFTRDAFGRALSSTAGNDTTQLGYTATGQLEELVTANDDAHFQFFNGVDLLTEYIAPPVTGTDDLTEYFYDNTRRLTTTTLPGPVTLMQVRDGLDPAHPERKGRLRSVASFNDGNGTSPVQISYTYADEVLCPDPGDPASCPPAGPPGQLATLARGDITTTLTWDGFMPLSETHAVAPGSPTGLVNTEYAVTLNANFLAQSDRVTAGASTFTARYDYDNDTVLRCAGHGATCAETNGVVYHFDNGPGDAQPSGHGLLEGTTSGAVTEGFVYTTFGELAAQVVSVNGAQLITRSYDDATAPRDALGRITKQAVTRDGQTQAVTYGYDAKGQLSTVSADGEPTLTNEYDANGNRLCTYEAPATGCADPAIFDAQDRLLSYDGVEYLYTDRGSLFQRDDGSTLETFTYDALGNLTRVERDGSSTIDYTLDAQGRRVAKHVDGALEKQYVWSGALRIGAELDAFGDVTSRFIYGSKPNVPDLIVKSEAGGTRLYRVITDHLGSPVYIVNVADANDVLLDASYDEWGNVTAFTSSTGAWPIPFGFAGGLYDQDTGLVRFGARDYDPRLGRWTSKDPIRWAGGQANLYIYVGNDPLNMWDPTGLSAFGDFLSGAASYGNDLGLGLTHLAAQNGLLGSELQTHANRLNSVLGAGILAGLHTAPEDTVQRAYAAIGQNKAFIVGRMGFGLASTLAIGRLGGSKIGVGLGAIAAYGGLLRLAMRGNEEISLQEGLLGVQMPVLCD